MDNLELVAQAYKLGEKSIIDFRRLFIPSDDDVEPAWFHYDWDNILRTGTKHYAVEAFRESAKSQLVIRGFLLYRLVYPIHEQSYIIILKANQTEASKKLKEIANEYQSNPWLSSNLVKINEENQKAFDVDVKDKYGKVINIRIEAYGKGSSIRGISYFSKRPQIIVCDDLQDLSDSQSTSIQTQDWEWFTSDVLFLGKKTRIFMIGNNLGEACLIERVASGKSELGFDFVRIPILDEFGKSNWDSYWDTKSILDEREKHRKLGTISQWMREKMCIAIAPEKQIFKKEYYKYYSPDELDKGSLSIYTTVDLAISQKDTADFTSICTVGVNKDNHWFLLDITFGRFDPSQTIDKIFDVVQKYKPLFVGIEKVAFQASIRHFLEKEMPKRNCFFTVKDLLAEKKKELRIEMIQPRFVTGTMWFPENAQFLGELEQELLAFPKGLHDDLIDSLAYMEQIALPPVGSWGGVKSEDIPYAGSW